MENNISPIFSPVVQALQLLFGRSATQLEIIKGAVRPEDRLGSAETLDSKLNKIFMGYADISQDRIMKYRDFDRMDLESSEIQTGLDIYAEEASQPDDKTGRKCWVESSDPAIADELNNFLTRINWESKCFGIYRNIAKYGDVFLYLLTGKYGVHDTQFIHPSRIERVQDDGLLGFKSAELARLVPMDNKNNMFPPWQLVHFRVLAYDQENIYGRCVDKDTEILTKNGWKLFKNLIPGEEVATRNPKTKEFEWQIPTDYIEQDYSGDMIHFKSQSLDLLVTPNHRIPVTVLPKSSNNGNQRHPSEDKEEVILRAEELLNVGKHVRIPMTSNWVGEEIKEKIFLPEEKEPILVTRNIPSNEHATSGIFAETGTLTRPAPQPQPLTIGGDDFCRLMGAYLSEGNVRSAGGIEIAQQTTSKGYFPYLALLERILGKVQYNGKAFVIPRRVLTSYFKQFGHSHEKFVPDEIMNATPKQLKLFWDYYVLGDGGEIPRHQKTNRGLAKAPRTVITTVSKKMAGQLQEIAQKLGISALISEIPPKSHAIKEKNGNVRTIVGRHTQYRISVIYSKAMNFSTTKEKYNDKIYCVSVPNTIIYVRRNGKPIWTGNSFCDSLRKVWKQLSMLESMIVIYRIAKTVQRNIFYVDVGQSSPAETAQLIKSYEQFLKNKTSFIDPKTKEFRLDFNPATMLQDIVWPTRQGTSSRVEYLQNTAQIGPMMDLEYFRNKIRSGLNIPKEYFDGEQTGAWDSKAALILQDVRFSRKITRLQDAMREGVIRMCQIHWAIAHQTFLQPNLFSIRLGTISAQSERQQEEVLIRKGQILVLLASIADTMMWNKQVWSDYLLDQVYPLPKELRDKLYEPDPSMFLASKEGLNALQYLKNEAGEIDPDILSMFSQVAAGIRKGKGPQIKRGKGSFAAPGGSLSSWASNEEYQPILNKAENLTEAQFNQILNKNTEIKERLDAVGNSSETPWKRNTNWKKLLNLGNIPDILTED